MKSMPKASDINFLSDLVKLEESFARRTRRYEITRGRPGLERNDFTLPGKRHLQAWEGT